MGVFNFIQGHFNRRLSEENGFKTYEVQRSELLDDKTCNYCISMDGRTVKPDDPLVKYPQFHLGCRGIWVDIDVEEIGKPDITGVPKKLRENIGQILSKPMVLKGSLAEEFLNERGW